MKSKSVVITGYGAVTPLGLNAQDTWRALLEGKSGVSPIQRFRPAGFPVRFAAEIKQMEHLMRDAQYLEACSRANERHRRFFSSYK